MLTPANQRHRTVDEAPHLSYLRASVYLANTKTLLSKCSLVLLHSTGSGAPELTCITPRSFPTYACLRRPTFVGHSDFEKCTNGRSMDPEGPLNVISTPDSWGELGVYKKEQYPP
jgi:hypothetical protein